MSTASCLCAGRLFSSARERVKGGGNYLKSYRSRDVARAGDDEAVLKSEKYSVNTWVQTYYWVGFERRAAHCSHIVDDRLRASQEMSVNLRQRQQDR